MTYNVFGGTLNPTLPLVTDVEGGVYAAGKHVEKPRN